MSKTGCSEIHPQNLNADSATMFQSGARLVRVPRLCEQVHVPRPHSLDNILHATGKRNTALAATQSPAWSPAAAAPPSTKIASCSMCWEPALA